MKILLALAMLTQFSLAAEVKKEKSFKETVNHGADNIDRETRKIIKSGKKVWNDKVINAPSKPTK